MLNQIKLNQSHISLRWSSWYLENGSWFAAGPVWSTTMFKPGPMSGSVADKLNQLESDTDHE